MYVDVAFVIHAFFSDCNNESVDSHLHPLQQKLTDIEGKKVEYETSKKKKENTHTVCFGKQTRIKEIFTYILYISSIPCKLNDG